MLLGMMFLFLLENLNSKADALCLMVCCIWTLLECVSRVWDIWNFMHFFLRVWGLWTTACVGFCPIAWGHWVVGVGDSVPRYELSELFELLSPWVCSTMCCLGSGSVSVSQHMRSLSFSGLFVNVMMIMNYFLVRVQEMRSFSCLGIWTVWRVWGVWVPLGLCTMPWNPCVTWGMFQSVRSLTFLVVSL